MAISLQREICFACEIITQVHAPKHWSPGDGAIMDSCRLFRRQGLAAGNWFLRKRALNIFGLNYGLIILLLFTKSCHHFFLLCWTALPWNYELTEITTVNHLLPTTKKVNDTSSSNRKWSCLAEKILASLPSSVSMSEQPNLINIKGGFYLNPWLGYPSSCHSLCLYFYFDINK